MSQSIPCGTFRVSEPTVYHYAGYECAAWWRDIRVEPGEYPVEAQIEHGRVKHFLARLQGTIVADNFQSLYCGVAIGKSYDEKQNEGKAVVYPICPSDYSVFQTLKEEGSAAPWQIDIAKLPNIGTCIEPTCGSYVSLYGAPRRCPTCAVKHSQKNRTVIENRHAFLCKTAYSVRPTQNAAIMSHLIENHLQSGRTDDYYKRQMTEIVAGLRKVGPAGRIAARERWGHSYTPLGA